MVFLNIMVLCEIHPQDIKRWFMEVCAIDAYEWVMVGNIWAMGHFTTKYMKKPYLSTENYLVKMSDYKADDVSGSIWNSLFYDFLWTKVEKLKGTASIYTRNLAYFKKLDSSKKQEINVISKAFKNKVSYKS
jgi:deoxyribodipyrimidine photolyase-related protein